MLCETSIARKLLRLGYGAHFANLNLLKRGCVAVLKPKLSLN